jgi:Saf4/Yju2 protein
VLLSCGEYIYKGRKFNARKEATDEKYYSIPIYRFYIRCTKCSAEICFKTDPKHLDYECEKGATRNFEPWREAKLAEETEEERLDRLEREEAERDKMADLEAKTLDTKTELAIADALDEIRMRNARIDRTRNTMEEIVLTPDTDANQDQAAQELEDEEAAKRAFHADTGERVQRLVLDDSIEPDSPKPVLSFERTKKKQKKDAPFAFGIKRKGGVV